MSENRRTKPVQVLINVYDLHKSNRWLHCIGLGIYHTAVELKGKHIGSKEYSFGGDFYSESTGVFSNKPRHVKGAKYVLIYASKYSINTVNIYIQISLFSKYGIYIYYNNKNRINIR